jgi:anti-sigma factor RsiW
MTHEQVRELLPEHLLGSLAETDDAAIRRHLRGCAECRDERARLEDGVAALSYATEQDPPESLRDDVLGVLADEWRDPDPAEEPTRIAPPGTTWRWLAVAAAFVLVVVSAGWGVAQARRANGLQADAASYQSLLATLGGKEFRLGTVHGADGADITGTVVLYDGDPSHGWSSWGIVMVNSPSFDGDARAMLIGKDGRTLELPPLRFSDGEAASWLVTHDDITPYDRLVITSPQGDVLANASIAEA